MTKSSSFYTTLATRAKSKLLRIIRVHCNQSTNVTDNREGGGMGNVVLCYWCMLDTVMRMQTFLSKCVHAVSIRIFEIIMATGIVFDVCACVYLM